MEITRVAPASAKATENRSKQVVEKTSAREVVNPDIRTNPAVGKAETKEAVNPPERVADNAPTPKRSKTEFREILGRLISLTETKDGHYESRVPPEEVLRAQEKLKIHAQEVLGTLFEKDI